MMKNCERVALNFMLSDYPLTESYDDVLDLISNKSDAVVIWQPFENDNPEDVIEIIQDMKNVLLSTYGK